MSKNDTISEEEFNKIFNSEIILDKAEIDRIMSKLSDSQIIRVILDTLKSTHTLRHYRDNEEKIPENINSPDVREQKIALWKPSEIQTINFNERLYDNDKSTIPSVNLVDASTHIINFFKDNKIKMNLNILDIGCGNCKASSIIFKALEDKIKKSEDYPIKSMKWISTDIIDYKGCSYNGINNFDKLNSVDSIKKYGKESNVLLFISPQPGHTYLDYYACYDFIEQTQNGEDKYIIIIGELGGGDGTEGMYGYLHNNPKLNRVYNNRFLKYQYDFKYNITKLNENDMSNASWQFGNKLFKDTLDMENGKHIVSRIVHKEVVIFKIKPSKLENISGGFYEKYLKYKNKYLELKKRVN